MLERNILIDLIRSIRILIMFERQIVQLSYRICLLGLHISNKTYDIQIPSLTTNTHSMEH
jgi:hypothetical protein